MMNIERINTEYFNQPPRKIFKFRIFWVAKEKETNKNRKNAKNVPKNKKIYSFCYTQNKKNFYYLQYTRKRNKTLLKTM